MDRLTRRFADRATQPPARPGPAVDPDDPARLAIAHSLRDQPHQTILLVTQCASSCVARDRPTATSAYGQVLRRSAESALSNDKGPEHAADIYEPIITDYIFHCVG